MHLCSGSSGAGICGRCASPMFMWLHTIKMLTRHSDHIRGLHLASITANILFTTERTQVCMTETPLKHLDQNNTEIGWTEHRNQCFVLSSLAKLASTVFDYLI